MSPSLLAPDNRLALFPAATGRNPRFLAIVTGVRDLQACLL